MANKLPWFPHDHDAHDDHFIQESMDKFEHFGYSSYFIILELLHKEGIEDELKINATRLCRKLRSKRDKVTIYLRFCGDSGKIESRWIGDYVTIKIKKVRKKWSNLKSKVISTSFQNTSKVPIYRDRDRDKILIANKPQDADLESKPAKRTPIQNILRAYKQAKGIDRDDKQWDKHNFSRYSKAAKKLLDAFGGDVIRAGAFLFDKADAWKSLDWGLDGVAAKAWDLPKEERGYHGQPNIKMGADGILGQAGHNGIAQEGERAKEKRGLRIHAAKDVVQDALGGLGVHRANADEICDKPFLGPEDAK